MNIHPPPTDHCQWHNLNSSSNLRLHGPRVGLLALGVPVPPGREVELAAAMERLTPLAPLAVGGATAAPWKR